MHIRKSYLFASLLIAFMIAFGTVVYFVFFYTKIVVIDKSSHYNLTYIKNDDFEEIVSNIGAWHKDKRVTLDSVNFFTPNRIVIELVDNIQPRYQTLNDAKEVLLSNDVARENNDLNIKIYLNPKLKSNRITASLANPVLILVLNALNSTIGKSQISGQEVVNRSHQQYKKLENDDIFRVSDN